MLILGRRRRKASAVRIRPLESQTQIYHLNLFNEPFFFCTNVTWYVACIQVRKLLLCFSRFLQFCTLIDMEKENFCTKKKLCSSSWIPSDWIGALLLKHGICETENPQNATRCGLLNPKGLYFVSCNALIRLSRGVWRSKELKPIWNHYEYSQWVLNILMSKTTHHC